MGGREREERARAGVAGGASAGASTSAVAGWHVGVGQGPRGAGVRGQCSGRVSLLMSRLNLRNGGDVGERLQGVKLRLGL